MADAFPTFSGFEPEQITAGDGWAVAHDEATARSRFELWAGDAAVSVPIMGALSKRNADAACARLAIDVRRIPELASAHQAMRDYCGRRWPA